MKAAVVFESVFGNTAQIARAIAAGLGEGARALSTAEADREALDGVDLLVAGAPVFAFHLSSDRVRDGLADSPEPGAPAANLSHPSIREWLNDLPEGVAACATFDTQVRGPFGKGAPTIAKAMQAKGYRLISSPEGFVVAGKYGPLRDGEQERATAWGAQLARLVQ